MSSKSVGTGSNMRAEATGKHWEERSQRPAFDSQLGLELLDPQATSNRVSDGYEVLRRAVEIYGGNKKLALEIGKPLSYEAKISEAINRTGDRRAHFDWLIPILRHPQAGPLLLAYLCDVADHEMGEPRRAPTAEDCLRAFVERCDEDGKSGADRLRTVADAQGLSVGALRTLAAKGRR